MPVTISWGKPGGGSRDGRYGNDSTSTSTSGYGSGYGYGFGCDSENGAGVGSADQHVQTN